MLQFITNSGIPSVVIDQAQSALEGGCKWIQLRMKNSPRDIVISTARELKQICAQYGCILVIDDYVEIAKELQLDGVHLGKSDMSVAQARLILGMGAIIGSTANTFEDIQSLARQDADYVGLGPFRYTETKKNLSPILGLEGYARIMRQCRENDLKIPVVAIGGITADDIPALMDAGVSGIALSGTILQAENPEAETRKIIEEAIEIANRNQQYRNFEIQIPEKKWKTKSFREMRELARKQKSHIGNWVEVALWWATQIQKEEDWEYMCNDVENTEWYKVADWKHTLAYVGNCTSNSGKASATEVYECSYLHRIQICDAVPYLVR